MKEGVLVIAIETLTVRFEGKYYSLTKGEQVVGVPDTLGKLLVDKGVVYVKETKKTAPKKVRKTTKKKQEPVIEPKITEGTPEDVGIDREEEE